MKVHLTKSAPINSQLFELGQEAELLRYIPFDKVIVDQINLGTAYPKTILYGKITGRAATVWIYWSKKRHELKLHSLFDDNSPDGWLTPEDVVEKATPSEPFHFIDNANDLCVLATYYLLLAGVGMRKSLRFLPYQLSAFLTMAKKFEAQARASQKSMIVVLPVRFPASGKSTAAVPIPPVSLLAPGIIVTGSTNKVSTFRTIRDNKPQSGFDQRQDSTEKIEKGIKRTHKESTGPALSPGKSSLIDRYLEYSRQERTTERSLETVSIRIQQPQKELEVQDKERIRLNDLKLSIGEVKRKAWDAMSKEELWELGRRVSELKRQRNG
ncbi:hypothetical protein E8E12_004797 [Didymella heteroderae]|uniref:Uncharacterized protein n=1 Tax=Didymella heteroderae TaxID=1769908 RepID=A0A9P4WJG1_9PLEO|nr:hypothetical protein E8E12_004797 [Didymella heteroderae]